MRYPALRAVAFMHYALAVVIAVMAMFGMISAGQSQLLRAGIAVGAIAAMVMLVGFAELLNVLMDIEANTRALAERVPTESPPSTAAPPMEAAR